MTIIFTVTNDLTYDQRMHRICGTLAANGYTVTLIGRSLPHSIPLKNKAFVQKRLHCFFRKGFPLYAEYNLRLFFFLLFARYDAVCSTDLDTLPAGCLATLLRRKKRVFDAHEYFTEVPEVVGRPFVKGFWEMTAHICLPFYKYAYTVGTALAHVLEDKYGLKFGVVRNVAMSALSSTHDADPEDSGREAGAGEVKRLFYIGALNEGRGIEAAIEAMQFLDNAELWLAGEGDLSDKLRRLVVELKLQGKVRFFGYVKPDDIPELAAQTWLGLNLLENRGLSYYYSLANKFFTYVQAGIPVLTMNFPEYRALNVQHEVAVLLDEMSPGAVVAAVKKLREDELLYARLQKNCLVARKAWTWEQEEDMLLKIWAAVFTTQKPSLQRPVRRRNPTA